MSSQKIVAQKKNDNAHGLRGWAALTVGLSHFVLAFLPFLLRNNCDPSPITENYSPLFLTIVSSPIIRLFYNGNLPVMIFFVLSGYVLTTPYFKKEKDPFILHRRLWGRYLRLNIPISATVLISSIIYLCHGYYIPEASTLSGSVDCSLCFKNSFSYLIALKNILWSALIEGSTDLDPVFWTLKAEFIGSLLLLLFYIAKPKEKNFLCFLAALLLVDVAYGKRSIFIITMFLGSLLNALPISKKYYLLLLLTGCYFGGFQYDNALYDFLPRAVLWQSNYFYSGLGALLITGPLLQGYGKTILQHRIFQFLGTISFPFYLLHCPVVCSLSSWLYLLLPHTLGMLLINLLLFLAVSIGLATLFERYVDKPAIALAHRFARFLFPAEKK